MPGAHKHRRWRRNLGTAASGVGTATQGSGLQAQGRAPGLIQSPHSEGTSRRTCPSAGCDEDTCQGAKATWGGARSHRLTQQPLPAVSPGGPKAHLHPVFTAAVFRGPEVEAAQTPCTDERIGTRGVGTRRRMTQPKEGGKSDRAVPWRDLEDMTPSDSSRSPRPDAVWFHRREVPGVTRPTESTVVPGLLAEDGLQCRKVAEVWVTALPAATV